MTTVTLPKIGDTGDAVVVVEWLARPGDRVEADQPLLRVETAKVEVEVPSPIRGVVTEILADVDQEVAVGEGLAVIVDE